jgi:shikimate kinase
VIQATGRTVAQVFSEDGEPRFRDLEAAALRSAEAICAEIARAFTAATSQD